MTPRPTAPAPAPASALRTCLRVEGEGRGQRVILDLSISPRAKRSELVGWHDGALRLRVAAPPVEGAANDAVRRWLSDSLGLPLADIQLLRGAAGRRKQWALNTDLALVERWLDELMASGRLQAPTL